MAKSNPAKHICVYSSSSDAVNPLFFKVAQDLGARIALKGYGLVYGGTDVGLMGALARAVHEHGGRVVGVIPDVIKEKLKAPAYLDELVVTPDLRARKAAMEQRADAFVGLPGGFGTLEELFEVITLKQLRVHNKPIALINAHGFYDGLVEFLEQLYRANFIKDAARHLYLVTSDIHAIFPYFENTPAPQIPDKWFKPKDLL